MMASEKEQFDYIQATNQALKERIALLERLREVEAEVPQQYVQPPTRQPQRALPVQRGQSAAVPCRNLYFNKLPQGYSEGELREVLVPYGEIVRMKVNPVQRWGLVEFADVATAEGVIAALNGAVLREGEPGIVVEYNKKQGATAAPQFPMAMAPAAPHPNSYPISPPPQPSANVYLSNLPGTYTDNEVAQLLMPFGDLVRRRVGGVGSTRWALAEFVDPSCAHEAIQALSGTVPPGGHAPIRVEHHRKSAPKQVPQTFAMPPAYPKAFPAQPQLSPRPAYERQPGANLYLNDLPGSYSEAEVRTLLEQIGPIKRLRVCSSSKSDKNYALVEMMSPDDAGRAIAELNGIVPEGSGPIIVEYSQNRAVKRRVEGGEPIMKRFHAM